MVRTQYGRAAWLAALLAPLIACATPSRADKPLPIRFVVVTTFDTGSDDSPNAPGEFNSWVVNYPLPVVLPFPQGYHHLRYNPDQFVLGIETGEGPTHMASSITALVNDPRFDFSHAYWMLAGIAGIDPNAGPVASAAWSHYVIDGDLAYEIDAREIPSDWTTGYVPLGRSSPYQQPVPPVSSINGVNLFKLNGGFVNWAYEFSKARVHLPDDSNLQTVRAGYTKFPKTQSPPIIMEGDVLGAGTFWTGTLLNTWAENWVNYWSKGAATFVMTSEEDAGYAQALTFLAQTGAIDFTRVLVLRSAANFSVPPNGETAAEFLAGEANGTGYSGFIESLANVYATGASVVNEIVNNWGKYEYTVPTR